MLWGGSQARPTRCILVSWSTLPVRGRVHAARRLAIIPFSRNFDTSYRIRTRHSSSYDLTCPLLRFTLHRHVRTKNQACCQRYQNVPGTYCEDGQLCFRTERASQGWSLIIRQTGQGRI